MIQRALQEYELGNWAEAKLLFSDANALYPNARTLRGLGLTAYESRDYVAAIGFIEASLSNSTQPLSADMRGALSKLLAQARHFVARVQVALEPSSARLTIDEHPLRREPDGTILLDPGPHELLASATGYDSGSRRLNVEAGAQVRLELQLMRLPATGVSLALPAGAPGPSAPTAAVNDSGPRSIDPGPWIVISGSGAAAIVGGVLLAVASSDLAKVENARMATESGIATSPATLASRRTRPTARPATAARTFARLAAACSALRRPIATAIRSCASNTSAQRTTRARPKWRPSTPIVAALDDPASAPAVVASAAWTTAIANG